MFFFLPFEDDKPAKAFPLVNLSLIAANVYFFFTTATRAGFDRFLDQNGFVAAHPNLHDALASMFLHAGLGHLLGNMYFLYIFGDNVEDHLGKPKYLTAYLLAGFGALATQYAMDPHSTVPLIGASGAISGVCSLYMLMFPWRKMRLQFFFLIFPIFSIPTRALFLVGLWFLAQYFMARYSSPTLGGVAFWAHVGGFLTGILLYPFLYRKPKAE